MNTNAFDYNIQEAVGIDYMHMSDYNLCKLLVTVLESPRFTTWHESIKVCQAIAAINGWIPSRCRDSWRTILKDHAGTYQIEVDASDNTVRFMKLMKPEPCKCCGRCQEPVWEQVRGYGTKRKVRFMGDFRDKGIM